MWSIEYKPGWFIHGHFDRAAVFYGKGDAYGFGTEMGGAARTLLGAKRAITKLIREGF